MINELNINDVVCVQLSEFGRKEWERQVGELREGFPSISKNYFLLDEDDEGWSKWQLHSLMNTFGHMMHNGSDLPFSSNIKIQSKPRMINVTMQV